MRRLLFGTALLGTMIIVASADAAPVPAIDVPAMTTAADVIVVGRATGVAFHGSLSETFAVSVDRVLKGTARNLPSPNSVRLDVSTPGFQAIVERQYGIYFLNRAPGGEYAAVDPFHAVLVASPAGDVNSTGPTNVLAAVTRELAQVFVTPPASLTNPITGIQTPAVPEPVAGVSAAQLLQIYLATAAAIQSIPFETSEAAIRSLADPTRLSLDFGRSIVCFLWAIRISSKP